MKLTLKQAVSTIILVLSLPARVTYVSARHPINGGEDGMLAPTAALLLCNQHRIIFIFRIPRNNTARIVALWAIDA
jgi:hypothetical protein